MSQFPPPPEDPPQLPQNSAPLEYETPRHGNAPFLIKLACIFTLISAGIDFVFAVITIGMTVFLHWASAHAPAPAPGAPPGSAPPPLIFFDLFYGLPGMLSLAAIVIKLIGSIKLTRRSRNAWGWGLAAAIVGCGEIWMFITCCVLWILPLAAGIYSIVILCLSHVREYLRAQARNT